MERRVGYTSWFTTGDRAEISYTEVNAQQVRKAVLKSLFSHWASIALTKDRRYESKDSLEMPKCSISPRSLLVSVELRDK